MKCSVCAYVCLNPLESGQSFESGSSVGGSGWRRVVSIPSNRGSHSNINSPADEERIKESLNPLESGQSFEYTIRVRRLDRDVVSQSPRIGAVIRMKTVFMKVAREAPVSIPSNRGSHSNYQLQIKEKLKSEIPVN